MTKEEARERMDCEGLMYGDAVMLVASFIPEGMSRNWAPASQKRAKEWVLQKLESWRKEYGTSDFNLNRYHWLFGFLLLLEFG